jgi:four helix bundle protein
MTLESSDPVAPPHDGKVYDLVVRTREFSKRVVLFCLKVPRSPVNDRMVEQLVDAGTSVDANYHEADDASSPRDYRHKVSICKKESKECMFWLPMIATSEPKLRDEAVPLYRESRELNRILGKIMRICDAKAAAAGRIRTT